MGQHNERLFGSQTLVRTGLAFGSALLLAGCGAGQITQTDTQLPAVDGGGVHTDSIVISNATLAYPEDTEDHFYRGGSDAPVTMHIANRADEADELLSVSSNVADEVTVDGETTVLAGRAIFVVTPDELDGGPETLPATAVVDSDDVRAASIVLNDLEHTVRPGQSVTLELTFREAGTIEVLAPIAESPDERVLELDEDQYREETDRLGSTEVEVQE
ncbi:copper chaperone PCu(A)C [Haloechinothrix sp. LS1_15]|uniref:copper chaperone PCu(A)C n=1 Tax=Haloechinothrix sp. LS1_15 TaxID=2652248 RepID=UPI0029456B5B|nr:copper chaperone PCu(A)C [Haloechinothrix sp. LS1_15]MDV6014697.1 copper chaperone PCu(A)C [Haloechinothrix sp. LS1_15]